MQKETIVISLGGSLIAPNTVAVDFLKDFRDFILFSLREDKNFAIVTGGGNTARGYIEASKSITQASAEDLDWIGIAGTRLNAELVRVLLGDRAFEQIVLDPGNVPKTDKILVGGGWKPGNSSDLASVQMAKSVGAKKLINLSNIDYVYDKDPNLFDDAKKIEKISWADFRKILPESWEPGLSSPFDPVAAKEAETLGLTVYILNGKNIENIKKCIFGEEFIGTTIS